MGGREFNNDLFVLRRGCVLIPVRHREGSQCLQQVIFQPPGKKGIIMMEKNVQYKELKRG